MNLKELDELCSALEDKGLYREAQVLHEKFIKESQAMMPQTSPTSFSGMLKEYAPTFVKLLAVAPTRVQGARIPTFAVDDSSNTISLVQELILNYKDPNINKTGLKVNGIAGPNTLRVMGDLKRVMNKILFDGFAMKYQIKDKFGKILTIENFKSF